MDELYKIQNVTYNATGGTLKNDNAVIDLTAQQNRLLRYLVLNAGQTLTKEQITAHVWRYDVDSDVSNLIYDTVSAVRRPSAAQMAAEEMGSVSATPTAPSPQKPASATRLRKALKKSNPQPPKPKKHAKACRPFLRKAPRSSRSIRSICCLWATVCIKKRGFCSPSAISKSFRRSAWSPAQPTPSPRTRFTAGFYPKASGRAFCAHTPKKAAAERCMAAKVQANCSST